MNYNRFAQFWICGSCIGYATVLHACEYCAESQWRWKTCDSSHLNNLMLTAYRWLMNLTEKKRIFGWMTPTYNRSLCLTFLSHKHFKQRLIMNTTHFFSLFKCYFELWLVFLVFFVWFLLLLLAHAFLFIDDLVLKITFIALSGMKKHSDDWMIDCWCNWIFDSNLNVNRIEVPIFRKTIVEWKLFQM